MYNKDLHISPKFAYHLNKQGMLDALVIAYQAFRETQNFPFEIKERRIAVQAVFKGLCELYASRGFKEENLISSKEILKEAKEIVEKIWTLDEKMWERKPEKESTKMVTEKIEGLKKEQNKDKKTFILDIKGQGKAKDFHVESMAKTKEEAYQAMLKEYPGLEKSTKSAVIKRIKLKK